MKLFHFLVLGIILAAAIGVRFIGLEKQMTHSDDIGVAWAILVQTGETYDIDYIRKKIGDSGHEDYDSPQFRFLRRLNDSDRLELWLPYLRTVMKFLVIPQSFTYAPLQFLITPFLISENQSYPSLLFWGRFPSFIFSILGLLLIVWVLRRLDGGFLSVVAGLVFLGFSWENIIYSRHMSGYAAGVAATLFLLALLIWILKNPPVGIRKGILIGLLVAAAAFAQYQVFYFLPAFFLIWLIDIWLEKNIRKGLIGSLGAAILTTALFLLPLAIVFLLPQAHVAGEIFSGTSYYFQPPLGSSFYGVFIYAIKFLAGNLFRIVRFATAMIPAGIALNVLSGIVLFLVVSGLVRMFLAKDPNQKKIGWFLALSGLTVLVLALAGKIALSPTRHSLIFWPYLAVAASFSLGGISGFFSRKINFDFEKLIALILTVLIMFLFFCHYQGINNARVDFFSESELESLVVEYQPRFAIAADQNLFFMAPFKNWQKLHGSERFFNVFENISGKEDVFLLVSRQPVTNDICGKMLAESGVNAGCRPGFFQVIFEKNLNSGATLDLLTEVHQIPNRFFLKIIKI